MGGYKIQIDGWISIIHIANQKMNARNYNFEILTEMGGYIDPNRMDNTQSEYGCQKV